MRQRATFRAVSLLFTFSFVLVVPASATTIVSPVMELEADPGTLQEGVVKVFNETSVDLFLSSSIEQFTAGQGSGQPVYIPRSEQDDFLNWFILEEKSIVVAPGEIMIVPFTVDIPADAVPGGYYAAIFWENLPPQRPGGDNLSAKGKVGTLIFLRVNGDVTEEGNVSEFATKGNKSFYTKLPVSFVTKFENSGNVHIRPEGTITVRNFWGKEKVFELGDGKANVLPGTSRQFEVVWGPSSLEGNFFIKIWREFLAELNDFTIGKYTATLELTYGTESVQTAQKQVSFWILPYHLLGGVALLILLLFAGLLVDAKIKKLKTNKPLPKNNEKS